MGQTDNRDPWQRNTNIGVSRRPTIERHSTPSLHNPSRSSFCEYVEACRIDSSLNETYPNHRGWCTDSIARLLLLWRRLLNLLTWRWWFQRPVDLVAGCVSLPGSAGGHCPAAARSRQVRSRGGSGAGRSLYRLCNVRAWCLRLNCGGKVSLSTPWAGTGT